MIQSGSTRIWRAIKCKAQYSVVLQELEMPFIVSFVDYYKMCSSMSILLFQIDEGLFSMKNLYDVLLVSWIDNAQELFDVRWKTDMI